MLISVRLEPSLKERIDSLVRSGHYPDFNAAAVVALENLWAMEEEHRSVGKPSASTDHNAMSASAPTSSSHGGQPVERSAIPHVQKTDDAQSRSSVLAWSRIKVSGEQIQPPPGDRFSAADQIPVERWVFGQQNRILPLKVNSRLLALACLQGSDDLSLDKMADRVSEGASSVREFLAGLDVKFDHNKDDLLATAFPAPGSDKSRQRYATHFVASESSNGELGGLMLEWKFAAVARKKGKAFLFPTQAGIEWANILNPLFDADVSRDSEKFSSEELVWALDHVRRNVPVEAFAFSTILNAITSGANDPTKLDANLRKTGKVAEPSTSPEFVATQRTGALSRMVDLDLVRRVRNGVRITYAVSERGEKWISSLKKK